MHYCGVCGIASGLHDEDCYLKPCNRRNILGHWPPLCCPGCACLSYEDAHDLPEPVELPPQYVELMNRCQSKVQPHAD